MPDQPLVQSAQALIEKQHQHDFRTKWLPLMIGGNVADAATTMAAMRQPGMVEQNPLLGSHPGDARVLLTKLVMTALPAMAADHLSKTHPTLAKVLSLLSGGVPAAAAISNIHQMQKQ